LTSPPSTPSPADVQPTAATVARCQHERTARLVGSQGLARLAGAHALIFGVGGVGSWAAEALVRAGVGWLTLVDSDLVCASNINRQLQATPETVGQVKVEVLARRLRALAPQARVDAVQAFYEAATAAELLPDAGVADVVLDAIDNVTAKCHLIARCRALGLPLVVSTGAAGRLDPTAIRAADLNDVEVDRLGKAVRKILRRRYAFPPVGRPSGVWAVYSIEPKRAPIEGPLTTDAACDCPAPLPARPDTVRKAPPGGTAAFVTGAMGFAAASVAVKLLLGQPPLRS